jgi:fatty acid desaturase
LAADALANVIRNVWAHAIIFCGHFPDHAYTFSVKEVENETRGGWYLRQLVGAANIEGSPLFHVISGNLRYQVEHHLYPDMPSSRYSEIAPKIKASAGATSCRTTPGGCRSSGSRCTAASSD